MDNEKRIFLAILLSIVVLYVYQAYFVPPPKKPIPKPAVPEQQQAPVQQPVTVPQPAPVQPAPGSLQIAPAAPGSTPTGPDRQITVSGSLFTALFSESCGSPGSFRLNRYLDAIEPPAVIRTVKKIFGDSSSPSTETKKQKELIHLRPGQPLPLRTLFADADTTMHGSGPWKSDATTVQLDSRTAEAELLFTPAGASGLALQKKFIFRDAEYKIDCILTVRNTTGVPHTGSPVIEWTTPLPAKSGGSMFGTPPSLTEFSYYINGGVEKKDVSKIKEPVTIEGDILWTAIEEKYFTSAILVGENKPTQIRLAQTAEQTVVYQLVYPAVNLQPGEARSCMFSLYLGPKDIDILKQQGSLLEKTVVFGWFDVIARPLLFTLKFFHRYMHNYGLAIILLTIIIKILFWPLTHKSFESMKSMQKIQPELAQLKEKYKDNKEEFARQQLSLYKKYKVNPLSGCLPTLIQIPVFIALYNALMYAIELRHAPFISFWINDLSAKDPTYVAPLVMGLSMLIQQKMTPTSVDPAQAKMMLFMPIVFTVMFLSFPSGLVIYWLVNNVISIAQQVYINRKLTESGGTTECTQSKSKQSPSKKRSR